MTDPIPDSRLPAGAGWRGGIRLIIAIGVWLWPVAAVLAIMLVVALAAGCTTYRGGKVVEGTDIAAGMSVPQSGGTLQIDALNFLTGFRFLFAEDSSVHCTYAVTNSVRAFGVYESTTVKSISIRLDPTVNEAEEESHATDRETETESDKPPPPDVGDTSPPAPARQAND